MHSKFLNRVGKNICISFLMVAGLLFTNYSFAQKNNAVDSSYQHRNNVKMNLTPWVLYYNVLVFSYERTISRNRSFSITGGFLKIPTLNELSESTSKDVQEVKKIGYTIGGDYLFYLIAENKYASPHGIYIGPYLNYYHFQNDRYRSFTDSSGNLSKIQVNSTIQVLNLGFQVGYQFVINNRFTIDCTLFAPSVARYSADISFLGNIDPAHADKITEEMLDALKAHFPMLSSLVNNGEAHVDGNLRSNNAHWAGGFKYSILMGYRFGK